VWNNQDNSDGELSRGLLSRNCVVGDYSASRRLALAERPTECADVRDEGRRNAERRGRPTLTQPGNCEWVTAMETIRVDGTTIPPINLGIDFS
jgi:hypothetical protein